MDKGLTQSEVAEGTKLDVLVDALCTAISSGYSSSLKSPWSVVVAKEAASPSKPETSPWCLDLFFSGDLKGRLSVQMTESDAGKLAQALATNSSGTSGGKDNSQPLEELWGKVVAQAEAALKGTWTNLQVEFRSGEAKTGEGTRIPLLASDASAAVALPLNIFVTPELLESLSSSSSEADGSAAAKSPGETGRSTLDLFLGVNLDLTLRFGRCIRSLREVLDLGSGAVIELDREVQQPADLLLGGKLIARGEVIIVDGNYGIRVTEVVDAGQRLDAV